MKLDKNTLTEEQQALEREFGVSYYITKEEKLGLKTNAKYDTFIKKSQQKVDINKLATLSDQLNLLAINLNKVVDILIKNNPTLAKDKNVIQGKKVLLGIQNILTDKVKNPVPKITIPKI